MTSFEILIKSLGYDIEKAQNDLQNVQSLNTAEFHDWQNEQKWENALYHYKNN